MTFKLRCVCVYVDYVEEENEILYLKASLSAGADDMFYEFDEL